MWVDFRTEKISVYTDKGNGWVVKDYYPRANKLLVRHHAYLSTTGENISLADYEGYQWIYFIYRHHSSGTVWHTIAHISCSNSIGDLGYHLFSTYPPTMHDNYGYITGTTMVVQGSISGDPVFLENVYAVN